MPTFNLKYDVRESAPTIVGFYGLDVKKDITETVLSAVRSGLLIRA